MVVPRFFKKPRSASGAGFTLIELLIVIAVIGILAVVVLVVLNPLTQFKKARDAERRNDLKVLQKALEEYYNDNDAYPSTSGNSWSSEPGETISWITQSGGEWIPGLSPSYVAALPSDPLGGDSTICPGFKRSYLYRSDGSEYTLLAHCSVEITPLNNPKDSMYDAIRPTYAWKICAGASACSTW